MTEMDIERIYNPNHHYRVAKTNSTYGPKQNCYFVNVSGVTAHFDLWSISAGGISNSILLAIIGSLNLQEGAISASCF